MEMTVTVKEFVRSIVHESMAAHVVECPVAAKMQRLEVRLAALVGYMAGSGIIGGTMGAVVCKLLMG